MPAYSADPPPMSDAVAAAIARAPAWSAERLWTVLYVVNAQFKRVCDRLYPWQYANVSGAHTLAAMLARVPLNGRIWCEFV